MKDYTAKPPSEFTLDDAIEVLEGKPAIVPVPLVPADESTKIMRQLNDTMSIRRGKYGCYVYYRPTPTATPQFIPLKKFPGKFLDVDIETVVEYAMKYTSMMEPSAKPVSKSKYSNKK